MREIFRKIAYILDLLSIQSRMGMVMIAGVLFVLFIFITLARYTLVDHDFYKKLADRQQLREIELSVNRGTIYATLDPNRGGGNSALETSILATTSIAKDLKIDPSASCNLDMLEVFLTDIVYEHLCLNRTQVSCYDNMLKYTNNFIVPATFDFSRDAVKTFIAPTVREQTRRIYKTRIFLADNLAATTTATLLNI
jgi:cell division protein FtsI/penicillin-binding protein 2